jgi:hypothetical protein
MTSATSSLKVGVSDNSHALHLTAASDTLALWEEMLPPKGQVQLSCTLVPGKEHVKRHKSSKTPNLNLSVKKAYLNKKEQVSGQHTNHWPPSR